MRKFLFLCLTALCSLVTQGLWAQDTGTLSWPLYTVSEYGDDGTTPTKASAMLDATTSPESAFASTSVTYGGDVALATSNTTRIITDNNSSNSTFGQTQVFTCFSNTKNDTDLTEDDAVEFNFTMAEGYTFTPTKITFYAGRIGTDGGHFTAFWVSDKDSHTGDITEDEKLVDATSSDDDFLGRLNASTTTYTYYEITPNVSVATTGTGSIGFSYYNAGTSSSGEFRSFGLSEINITGTVTTPEGATFELTLSPDGTDEVVSIPEITVTPAEGYTISDTTEDDTLEITLTATIDGAEVSYTGTATVDETAGTATITFADEEGNAITTEGEYTLTIPEGYFVTEDGATSNAATATYTVAATQEPGPEVEYPATATWDWQNNKPEGISETNIEGTTGTVASDVDGIELYVDATSGKLAGRYTETNQDAQMNQGTIIRVPVTSTSDVITVTSYPDYHYYTIGGTAASNDTEVYTPTDEDVEAGYVEIVATSTAYLYSIVAELQGPDEEGGDEGGSSIELLDEVDEGVYAITKTYDELMAIDGFSGSDGNCTASFNTGTIFYKDDNIKVEVASDYTYVANNGYQIADIQAIHPDYTAFINFGSQLSSIDETTDPTGQGRDWCGMLKVTPTADGGLTYSLNTGGNTRTLGIYDVEAAKWITIKSEAKGDVTVYGLVEEGKDYLLVGTGTNSNLYQIAFPAEEPEEPVVVEDEVIYTTDFTDWTELDLADSNGVEIDAATTTGEEFTFTLWGVSVDPGDVSQWNTDDEGNKTTAKFEGEGALIFAKYAEDGSQQYSECEPYVETSTISSVTKIVFTEAVTGSNRGVKISVKGDEDEDWVVVYSTSINSGSTEVEVDVNRTNCQIKIESIALAQNTYILDFTIYGVVEEEPVEGGLLYSTDFTEWETIDRTEANGDEVTVTTTTGGDLTFTLWGVGVDPTKTDESKFPDYVGAMITSKYAEDGSAEYSVYEPFAVTSTLGTVDKIVFTQVATGNNRGIKVSVKGDGDEDWVVLYNETIHTASGETIELEGINRTNCRIKFESFALAQNGYIADLKIYGTDFTGEAEDPDEQLYEDIRMEVDALGVDLTYAWANINLEYPESVEGLQSTYDAIKDEITNLQLVVEASHDGEELTADQASIEAQVAIIKAEIEALEAAATSINSITIDNNFEGKSIYTISGQKVSTPTKAGIYIIDGKKVVIK